MVRQLTYAIVADGGTDKVLQPIIERTIRLIDPEVDILEPDFITRRGAVRDFLRQYPEGPMWFSPIGTLKGPRTTRGVQSSLK